ncbi:MAG: histidine phosphatase family protein [Alphaproteobacteria bacterium]|nr:histidine phosphatase family protein [Alphaproteobacteria bacterium]
MKRLSLLRHAKSSWDDNVKGDFDRPLNRRGREAAVLMGAFMEENAGAPDCVLCSSAVRTRETLDIMAPLFSARPDIEYSRGLYLSSPADILGAIGAASQQYAHILVIAHNPGLHMLAMEIADPARSSAPDLGRLAEKFPTAALAHFEFDIDGWNAPLRRRGALRLFATPKDLAVEG